MKQKTIAKQMAYSGFVCQVAINTDQKTKEMLTTEIIDLENKENIPPITLGLDSLALLAIQENAEPKNEFRTEKRKRN